MAIPLERILTVTFGDYVASQDRKPNDYNLVGVHVNEEMTPFESSLIERIAETCPKGTEVVVNLITYLYTNGTTDRAHAMSGTALVPKVDERKKDKPPAASTGYHNRVPPTTLPTASPTHSERF